MAVLWTFFTAPLFSQNDTPSVRPAKSGPEDASHELLELQANIRSVKIDLARDRKAHHDRLQEVVFEKRATQKGPLQTLRGRVAKLKGEIARKKEEAAKKRAELEAKKKLSGELKGMMKVHLEGMLEDLATGLPWNLEERRDSVRRALAIVEDPSAALFSSLAAVGRVQTEEESLGRLVETATIELPYAGKRLAVHGFHLGLLAVIYASEDGSILGFVQAGQELRHGIEAVEGTPFAEEGYLGAVDILRRRRTPAIVSLYFPSLPLEGGAE